jgi:hypothetical protein
MEQRTIAEPTGRYDRIHFAPRNKGKALFRSLRRLSLHIIWVVRLSIHHRINLVDALEVVHHVIQQGAGGRMF